jgi:hypothetical protein
MRFSEAEVLATQGGARCYGDDEFRKRGEEQRRRAAKKKKSKTASMAIYKGDRST